MSGSVKFESEKFFVETMARILRSRAEYKVLYVNISRLKPKNSHPRFVRVVSRMFDNLVAQADGTMFVFENGDIVILGKNITDKMVEDAIAKLRKGLVTDPIWSKGGEVEFAKVYQSEEFDRLVGQVGRLMTEDGEDKLPVEGNTIDAGQIEAIKNHLDNISIIDLVKHQNVLKVEKNGKFKVVFDEFFVAVKDLSKRFDKQLDLTANKWLFLYLTQTLDKKTMSSFMFSDVRNKAQKISVNLNLSTIFSPEFEDFAKLMKDSGQSIIAEVQMMDIINNYQAWVDAKELLHRQGGEILLDAASVEMLQALNVPKFAPDYIKVFWHPLMGDYTDESFGEIVTAVGAEKFILAKALSEDALRWGLKNLITMFQGPYVDRLEAALIRRKCPQGKVCSLQDCMRRKKLIAGAERSLCSNLELLENMELN